MWFEILKFKPLTGKQAIKTRVKNIIRDYLLTVEIDQEFFVDDVLEFAQINNLLEGIENRDMYKKINLALGRNLFVDSHKVSGPMGYVKQWRKLK
tara:strand:- start:350 stop:634 length:285 start_codon:yes stop_codon:yes gene_type:complete